MSVHFWVAALFRRNLPHITNLLLSLLASAERILDLELNVVAHESLHFSELLWQHNAAVHVPRIQACLDKAKGTVKAGTYRIRRAFIQRHYQTPFFPILWDWGKEYNFSNSISSLRKGTPTSTLLMLKLVNHFSIKTRNLSHMIVSIKLMNM